MSSVLLDDKARMRDQLFDPTVSLSVDVVPQSNAYATTILSTSSYPSQDQPTTSASQGTQSTFAQPLSPYVLEYQANNSCRGRG